MLAILPAATPFDTSSLSEYALSVYEAAQTAMSEGTCLSRTEGMGCTGNCHYEGAESVYIEYTDDDWRYIIVNGIPDHPITKVMKRPQACENFAYMIVPKDVSPDEYKANRMGPIGMAITGGFFYNPKSSSSGSNDVAVLVEGDSFDKCGGHSDALCNYHYHEELTCLDEEEDCPHIGYLRDGISVYNYCTVNGAQLNSCYQLKSGGDNYTSSDYEWVDSEDCDLDENNGYTFSDGSYGYVLTDSYPYTPPGYMNTDYDLCYFNM